MQRRRPDLFSTIRTEGALLPPDLLARVAAMDKTLPGLALGDYHLDEDDRLSEVIGRAWNSLLGAWTAFQDALAKLPAAAHDPATSVTRDKWLLKLFRQLGYGQLQGARPVRIAGATAERSFPISHGWGAVPIHLVGARVPLDKRTPGVAGAATASPHGLVQDFLNASDEHLWGLVSNGLTLRLLRDNLSLTRQAYVEFDLQAMMEGEVYADFAVLFLVLHQSRLESRPPAGVGAARPEHCWLERWSKEAEQQGTRALEALRGGVEHAIAALGRGFLAHPANAPLRAALRDGSLDQQTYYRQLLRVVYRLLFLFVAEDRDLLLDPSAPPTARERYAAYYSLGRLRRLAERKKGTPHADLWRVVQRVMDALGSDQGCPPLGLPALGSFLWSKQAVPALGGCDLANADLLDVVRALAFVVEGLGKGAVRRAVDYKNLGSEELGSIYESLLELHPQLSIDAGTFALASASGNERKTTGSYYTPTSLITCLLDSALDPVLDEAVKQPDPEAALLNLKICDPACGSGHFLIAAAHRVARRLAQVRARGDEPAPSDYRHALRDVIGRCIYGVDVNPMAVELCKVALWMEALEPGRPLSFLDHRILCGNSLLGATPKLLAEGIPDEAYTALEGDDKKWAAALKKRNKAERAGQGSFHFANPVESLAHTLHDEAAAIAALADASVADLHEKERRHSALVGSSDAQRAKRIADAWCAAFVAKKTKEDPPVVTSETLRWFQESPNQVDEQTGMEVRRLSVEYGFFHWHLAFPDVFRVGDMANAENQDAGWSGGFDLLLGNPPWDTLSPDTKEFFSAYDPQIRFQDKAGQDQMIARLLEDTAIQQAWDASCRSLYAQVHFFKSSGRYVLFAPGNLGKGDFNIYRMFVETGMQVVRAGGMLAQFVPENLYNGANAMAIRHQLLTKCNWTTLIGFQNLERTWFPGIYYRMRFCLYAAEVGSSSTALRASFGIVTEDQLIDAIRGKTLLFPLHLIQEFSPDALAIMELSSQRDIDIAEKMYETWPKFGDETAGPHRHYMAEVHMGNDRDLFNEDPSGIPVYEGRMVDAFDHRAKGYRGGRGRAADWPELPFGSEDKGICPQWYISEPKLPSKTADRIRQYRIGFCNVASPTNERTLVAALIPARAICGHAVPTIDFPLGWEWAYCIWLAIANSFTMDYMVRRKTTLNLTFTILDSLPFPRLPRSHPQARTLVDLAARLTCTGPEMRGYWEILARDGWVSPLAENQDPPGLIDEEQRRQARAELDAIVARELFGLTRDELDYVLDTFPIVRRRDEEQFGEFRTKRLILDHFDRLTDRTTPVLPMGKLLPFRRVERPRPTDHYRSCVPLYALKAAAGHPDQFQLVEERAWVAPTTHRPLGHAMFVAQVEGDSMEPRVPSGSYCLFGPPPVDADGEIVLVELRGHTDLPEGGWYLLKRLRRQNDGRVELASLNRKYPPRVLDPADEVRVLGVLLEPLGQGEPS